MLYSTRAHVPSFPPLVLKFETYIELWVMKVCGCSSSVLRPKSFNNLAVELVVLGVVVVVGVVVAAVAVAVEVSVGSVVAVVAGRVFARTAGVPRQPQREEESQADQKGNNSLHVYFQYDYKL